MKPILDSERALWRKMEREAYRAIHASRLSHKADHFFNFCVTAHSMRDFFLETQAVPVKEHGSFHELWNGDPQLVAAKEIANLSKHFVLRHHSTRKPKATVTRRVRQRRTTAYDVLLNDLGEIRLEPHSVPEITVTTSDGEEYGLWEFVIDVMEYWRLFLKEKGVAIRRQPLRDLLDRPPDA